MKTRILIATMAIMSLFAISAFAQGFGMGGGYGRGGGGWGGGYHHMGGGYGPCFGGGGMWGGAGYGNGSYGNGTAINSESDAKALVQDIIDDNLKGYKVGDVLTVNGYNGNMYFVYATDNSGNTFTFMTGPYGGVRGPIPGKITPPTY